MAYVSVPLDLRPPIKQADLVIVPIENEFKSITSGINTLIEVAEYEKPLLMVATKLEKEKKEVFTSWEDSKAFQNIQNIVHAKVGESVKVLPLKSPGSSIRFSIGSNQLLKS